LRRLCLLIFAFRRFLSEPIFGCPELLTKVLPLAKYILFQITAVIFADGGRPFNETYFWLKTSRGWCGHDKIIQ
jgi:hypothetical protein